MSAFGGYQKRREFTTLIDGAAVLRTMFNQSLLQKPEIIWNALP